MTGAPELDVVRISARPQLFPDLAEAWRYRWMAVALSRRGLMTRYTQTMLGPSWFMIQPLMLTGILTLVMGAILKAPSDNIPYVVFAASGAVLWTSFNRSLQEISTSLVANGAIFSKVYFPRIIVPIAALLTSAAEFLPVYLVLFALVAAFGLWPGWIILLAPLFLLATLCLSFAIGLWLTTLDAFFRDVRLTLPFVMQFVFYFSPVIYASSAIPQKWLWLFKLNPFAGLLNAFRWSVIAGAPPPTAFELLWSCGFAAVALVGGLILFSRFEGVVVDTI